MANIEEAIRRLKYLYEVHGADQVARAQAAITASTTETERASLSLEKAFNNLERRYVPAVRAQQEYKRAQDLANDALKQNPALQERANVVLQNAQQQYLAAARGVNVYGTALNKGTGEARLARHEMINLSRQIQDVGVGLASGQSPFTILVQQGSQIADVFATSSGTLTGFFRQVGSGAARFLGSVAGIGTAVATMGASIGYAAVSYGSGQREIEKSLSGIGRASGVTRDQINEIAESSRSAFGLSTSEARSAAAAFAATGKGTAQSIGLATQALDAYERAGGDTAEMTKTLAAAMQDPAAGALELNKRFGILNATQLQYIQTLQSQGQLQQAQVALFTATIPKIEEQTKHTGWLTRGWNAATNFMSNYFDHLGKVARRDFERGTGISAGGFSEEEQLSRAKERLASFEKTYQGPLAAPSLKFLREEVERLTAAEQKRNSLKTEEAFRQLSVEAWAAARAIMPATAELEKLTGHLSKLQQQRVQTGGPVTGAEKVGNVRAVQIEQENAALVRQAEVTSQIALMYPTMTIEGAKQLYLGQQQLAVAQQTTVAGQLEAQQRLMITQLLMQGVPLHQAMAIAGQQRTIAEAQIAAQAQRQLVAAQSNLSVAEARTGAEKMVAQEIARQEQLMREGVSSSVAAQIAATERAAAEANVANSIKDQISALKDQERLLNARENGTTATVKAEIAYERAIAKGSSKELAMQLYNQTLRVERIQEAQEEERKLAQEQAAAQRELAQAQQQANQAAADHARFINEQAEAFDKLNEQISFSVALLADFNNKTGAITVEKFGNAEYWQKKSGVYTQFRPEGYVSNIPPPQAVNAGPLADRVNQMLGKGKSLQEVFWQVLKENPADQLAGQITALMPQDQQAGFIQTQLAALQGAPRTLETETLIKQLTDQLKQLSQSTDALNSTMQNALSPYYSQDPRTTRLGFRAGVMGNPDWLAAGASNDNPLAAVLGSGATVPGGASGYAGGGSFVVPGGYSATDNKIAQFPVASGETVTVGRGGSDRAQTITIDARIIVQGNVDAAAADKLKTTAFQRTQQMNRMLAAG